jgi:hypothetical protein
MDCCSEVSLIPFMIHDPCLFMKINLICFIYVDGTIFSGPDASKIQDEIKGLGISKYEEQHKFELRNEGEAEYFMGIRISKQDNGTFLLTQTGLIDKIIKVAGFQ